MSSAEEGGGAAVLSTGEADILDKLKDVLDEGNAGVAEGEVRESHRQ